MDIEGALLLVSSSLVRFASFVAHAMLFGIVPTALLVLRPSFAQMETEEWASGRRRLGARLEGLVAASLVASAVATVVGLALQAALVSTLGAGDVGTAQVESVLQTNFGFWYLIRLPLLAALAVTLLGRVGSLVLKGVGEERGPSSAWWALWGCLGIVLLATSSLSGHAAVSSPRPVALFNDVVHLGAGATWFAGIVVLAVALPDGWRGHSEGQRLRLLAEAVGRFSTLALWSIAIIAVTGAANSFFNLEQPGDLVASAYGATLAFKVTLFVVILGTGALNHFVLRRRLRAAADAGEAGGSRRLFRRAIALELAVGVLILGTTGLLTGLARTRPSQAAGGAQVVNLR